MAKINFFIEEISYQLKSKKNLRSWLQMAIVEEGFVLIELNFILCSDEYLLKINQNFLKHDYYTDVITFDNSTDKNHIAGDIYISIDRVKENAQLHQVAILEELRRIMIHGTLHLLGYKDKSKKSKNEMTAKENFYLGKY